MNMMQMLAERRTYRRFLQNKQISQDIIDDILTAQRCASSAANLQPLKYVVVKTPEIVEQVFPLVSWAARLPKELGTPKDGEHPTLFVAVLYEGVMAQNTASAAKNPHVWSTGNQEIKSKQEESTT